MQNLSDCIVVSRTILMLLIALYCTHCRSLPFLCTLHSSQVMLWGHQRAERLPCCLVYLGESFSLNLIAQATTSLENITALVKKTVKLSLYRRASLRGNVAATSSCLMLIWWKDHQHSSSSHCSPTWPGLFLLSLLQAQKVSWCSAWPATL